MARKLFGTDGIRGTANREPMTAETALRVAMAAGRRFTRGPHRHVAVIGKDTRLSNYMIEPAMQAGFISMGMDVVLVGPMPTPGVAMLTRTLRADVGVMISASHNPFEDNGIKLFGPDGYKLSDAVEAEIEQMIALNEQADHLAAPAALGRARRLDYAEGRYIEFIKYTFPRGLGLDGLKIVLDCANGAAYKIAPLVLYELGADVITIGAEPNGTNINKDCGATATQAMRDKVVETSADLGIALDGDADRLMVSDETGALLDGDQVMGLVARYWNDANRLNGGGVVATVMSNLGLERYLEQHGISLVRTKVGDRYVLEHMRANGFNVGGEQSGHIILSDYATTGDGMIAALQVLAVAVQSNRPLSELGRVFTPYPQILRNVPISSDEVLQAERVKQAIDDGRHSLGNDGRVLIRKSGTEPLVRVMAEGTDEALVETVVGDIVAALQDAIG